jgi:tetratricopeptide (TPR) repeat protein
MIWLLAAVLLATGPTPEKVQAQEHLKEGQRLMTSEKFEEAAEAFRQAITLDPLLTLAHYGLGQANMALKRYPPAVRAFRGARDAFHNIAADDLNRRLDNDAVIDDRIRALQDKIRQNTERAPAPGSSVARQLEASLQQWEIEIAMLQRAKGDHDVVETPAFLSLALGSAYFRSGQLVDAEREYRAALEVSPRLGEPRNNLAVVLLLTGRPAEAKEQLKIAEKNGFVVPPGLKQDVEAALAKAPAMKR